MRVRLSTLLFLSLSASALGTAGAQVHEAADGSSPHLWVGVEGSDFKPDYGQFRIYGYGFYGDYFVSKRLGVEAEVQLLNLNKPAGLTQKSFIGGPIVTVYRYHRLSGNVKVLFGLGTVTYPNNIGYGSYFELAPGGNVEYRLTPKLKLRGEYEYHFIPGAPGFPITMPAPSNGLTPSGYQGGISYRIF